MSLLCPICQGELNQKVIEINNYIYYRCSGCEVITIDPTYIDKIDEGYRLVNYNNSYWQEEIKSSWERSYGVALARMAEAFYYTRIPINKFLDIGTGPGFFLDAVTKLLPNSSHIFYGVEKYPPPQEYQTKHKNYIIGDLKGLSKNVTNKFDAGMCMEVIEHLTPKTLKALLGNLAALSNPQAFYIFNTGMPEYVIGENNLHYLDPTIRGHIVCYSLKSLKILAEELETDFCVHPIPGKAWAFALEYKCGDESSSNIQDRIWSALQHNLNILTDKDMGSALRLLGLETSRAYG